MPPYRYEPKTNENGQPIKHKWAKGHPGFMDDRTGHVEGFCPATVTTEIAEDLLASGIPDSPPGWTKSHPKYIYNIYQGAVYKAVETRPGYSYHGFPSPGPRSNPQKRDMSERMKRRLIAKARAENCEAEILAWFEEHP